MEIVGERKWEEGVSKEVPHKEVTAFSREFLQT